MGLPRCLVQKIIMSLSLFIYVMLQTILTKSNKQRLLSFWLDMGIVRVTLLDIRSEDERNSWCGDGG
jgi:hypothetical protein